MLYQMDKRAGQTTVWDYCFGESPIELLADASMFGYVQRVKPSRAELMILAIFIAGIALIYTLVATQALQRAVWWTLAGQ